MVPHTHVHLRYFGLNVNSDVIFSFVLRESCAKQSYASLTPEKQLVSRVLTEQMD